MNLIEIAVIVKIVMMMWCAIFVAMLLFGFKNWFDKLMYRIADRAANGARRAVIFSGKKLKAKITFDRRK